MSLALLFPFQVWPAAASSTAGEVDALFGLEVGISALMTLLIFSAITYFAFKYRRRSETERPRPIEGSVPLETAWSVLPLLVFLVFFGWGAKIYYGNAAPPHDAMQIYVVGKQWMWYVQHPGGQREINELHVPTGRAVQLIMTSQDVIHSFYLPEFRIKKDVLPGAYTTEWFRATTPGSYHLFCAEFCGTGHSHMIGTVYAMKSADYEQWLTGNRGEPMAAAGEQLYQRLGCVNCHNRIAPSLTGLYMKQVPLADGRIVTADDAYIRESVINPGAKIVAGFPNLMPSFNGVLKEQELMELIAYIRSLGTPATAGTGAGIGAGQGQGAAAGPGTQPIPEQRGMQGQAPPNYNPHTPQGERSDEVQRREGGIVSEPK
jgi:cytochrome c oxidase subunit 2